MIIYYKIRYKVSTATQLKRNFNKNRSYDILFKFFGKILKNIYLPIDTVGKLMYYIINIQI